MEDNRFFGVDVYPKIQYIILNPDALSLLCSETEDHVYL